MTELQFEIWSCFCACLFSGGSCDAGLQTAGENEEQCDGDRGVEESAKSSTGQAGGTSKTPTAPILHVI